MLNHSGTVNIDTERLILRKFEASDAENMFINWASKPEVAKFLSWEAHSDNDITRSVIDNWLQAYSNTNTYNWVIVYKENNQAIGGVSMIKYSEKHSSCELGYCIGDGYWNKGIMSEALRAVIKYLFEEVNFHRIEAKHDVLNPGSGRVMEKCGMKLEGTQQKSVIRKDGTWADMNMRAIINELYRG